MSEKNISIVKQHLEKLVKIVYIMLEIIHFPFVAEIRGQKTGERRQDRIFTELAGSKLEDQDAVTLETYILPPSLHNIEKRYNKFLILSGENGFRIVVRAQWAEYNPGIMPNNFIECLITDDSRKKLTRLKLNNNPDKQLSVTTVNNFPQNSTLNWEQGDAFKLLYKGWTDTPLEYIGSEKVTDGEEIDILLNIIQTARVNRELTQKTAKSWLNSDISVSTVPTIIPVNVLGQRTNFV